MTTTAPRQDDWHATRNIRPLATAVPVAEPEPVKDDPGPEPVDELHAWVRQLGPLRPAAPVQVAPATAPSWAARFTARCHAVWAKIRQETRTP